MLLLAEARGPIIEEWRYWRPKALSLDAMPETTAVITFLIHLRASRPELLDFEWHGDKMRVIREWLLEAGLIRL